VGAWSGDDSATGDVSVGVAAGVVSGAGAVVAGGSVVVEGGGGSGRDEHAIPAAASSTTPRSATKRRLPFILAGSSCCNPVRTLEMQDECQAPP